MTSELLNGRMVPCFRDRIAGEVPQDELRITAGHHVSVREHLEGQRRDKTVKAVFQSLRAEEELRHPPIEERIEFRVELRESGHHRVEAFPLLLLELIFIPGEVVGVARTVILYGLKGDLRNLGLPSFREG